MTINVPTYITVVLDRSGSMERIQADMCGGFDAFINEQKKLPGECFVSLYQFDNVYEQVYVDKPIAEVPKLVLEPRGSTALYDALGHAILNTATRLQTRAPAVVKCSLGHDHTVAPNAKVLFIVITDGQNNASVEWSKERVFEMVTRRQKEQDWQFIYLGANQNAMIEGGNLGIRQAVTYATNTVGVDAASKAIHGAATRFRSSGYVRGSSLVHQDDYDSLVKGSSDSKSSS